MVEILTLTTFVIQRQRRNKLSARGDAVSAYKISNSRMSKKV